jgi:hypothetical protein
MIFSIGRTIFIVSKWKCIAIRYTDNSDTHIWGEGSKHYQFYFPKSYCSIRGGRIRVKLELYTMLLTSGIINKKCCPNCGGFKEDGI